MHTATASVASCCAETWQRSLVGSCPNQGQAVSYRYAYAGRPQRPAVIALSPHASHSLLLYAYSTPEGQSALLKLFGFHRYRCILQGSGGTPSDLRSRAVPQRCTVLHLDDRWPTLPTHTLTTLWVTSEFAAFYRGVLCFTLTTVTKSPCLFRRSLPCSSLSHPASESARHD